MKFRLFIDHDAGPDHRRTDGKVIRAAFVSCRAFRTEREREREEESFKKGGKKIRKKSTWQSTYTSRGRIRSNEKAGREPRAIYEQ